MTHEVWERRAPAGRWEVVHSGTEPKCREMIRLQIRRGTTVRFQAPADYVALPLGVYPASDTKPDGTVAP